MVERAAGTSASTAHGVVDAARVLARHYPRLSPPRRMLCGQGRGAGVVLGLVEPAIHARIPDLNGADLRMARFGRGVPRDSGLRAHGTYATTLLVGQGVHRLCGLVPAASLRLALVADADGCIRPEAVGAAITWLVSNRVALLGIPIGSETADPGVAQVLGQAVAQGIRLFAAAGNAHPAPTAFPANDPAVLAVGAADARGMLCAECCRDPPPDLIAPGSAVTALADPSRLVRRNGTSVACTVALGFAALLLADRRRRRRAAPPIPCP